MPFVDADGVSPAAGDCGVADGLDADPDADVDADETDDVRINDDDVGAELGGEEPNESSRPEEEEGRAKISSDSEPDGDMDMDMDVDVREVLEDNEPR